MSWILCSEKEPLENQDVLVTLEDEGNKCVEKAVYKDGKYIYVGNDTDYEYKYVEPVAWMEMPKPFDENKKRDIHVVFSYGGGSKKCGRGSITIEIADNDSIENASDISKIRDFIAKRFNLDCTVIIENLIALPL